MNAVDVIFIIDNSVSMSGLEKDTRVGFTSCITVTKTAKSKKALEEHSAYRKYII